MCDHSKIEKKHCPEVDSDSFEAGKCLKCCFLTKKTSYLKLSG